MILLVFSVQDDAATTGKYLKIEEASVDGERQPIDKVAVAPVPTVYKVEFEDLLFRTDSAVVLPENYGDRKAPIQPRIVFRGSMCFRLLLFRQRSIRSRNFSLQVIPTVWGKSVSIFCSQKTARIRSILFYAAKRKSGKNLADKRNHVDDKRQILSWVSTMYGWDLRSGGT